jgi:hypothetical protein
MGTGSLEQLHWKAHALQTSLSWLCDRFLSDLKIVSSNLTGVTVLSPIRVTTLHQLVATKVLRR